MSEKGVDIVTGVGRIVWGHPSKATPKKYQDGLQKGQPVLKDGQPVLQYAFGVAFPKAEFNATVWPAMAAEAATGYPNGTPQRFAWKLVDGDGIDGRGQPYNTREGYAGCMVTTFSTELQATPVFKFENGAYRQLQPNEVKTGDFVVVSANVKVNVATGTNTPSLYVNPRGVNLIGYGTEIQGQGGIDPNAAFGGRQYALPPGASSTPLAPTGAPGMPTGPAPQAQYAPAPMAPPPGQPVYAPQPMPGQPAPVYAPQPAPMMPPPAPDFVANAGQHAQPVYAPQPMPGQPAPVYAPQPGFQPPR